MHDEDPRRDFDAYQRKAAETDLEGVDGDPLIPLLGLAGEVGALVTEYKKKHRPDGLNYTGFDEVVVTELGDVLWYLAALARRAGVSLSEVAAHNLSKTRGRWLADFPSAPLDFDSGFPVEERLPRQFTITFTTTEGDGPPQVRMEMDGQSLGDPIDDNARDPDYYRFHDAFHLAYAAVLGWSPILRALMRHKRKSDPAVDASEDGARACAVEEGIAALVFSMARPYSHFEGARNVDSNILELVQAATRGLEVQARSRGEWERAILVGFDVWRGLRDRGQGVVHVDLDAREVTLAPS
jgi:NTP pyrophosphatase (non-canonical NTP hydrolase)